MPGPEQTELNQDAILWRKSDTKNDYNRPVLRPLEEVKIRFKLGRTQSTDAKGTVISYDGSAVTEETYPIDSIMWVGELKDMPAAPTPLYQIKSYRETPDLKGRETKFTAMLVRYTDTLPTVEDS